MTKHSPECPQKRCIYKYAIDKLSESHCLCTCPKPKVDKNKQCSCKEMSCKEDCSSRHTHKSFSCKECEPKVEGTFTTQLVEEKELPQICDYHIGLSKDVPCSKCGLTFTCLEQEKYPLFVKEFNELPKKVEKVRGLSADSSRVAEILAEFEKEFFHKGEDGDDLPEKWNWTIKGMPIEVQSWLTTTLATVERESYERGKKDAEETRKEWDKRRLDILDMTRREVLQAVLACMPEIDVNFSGHWKNGFNQALNDWSEEIKNLKS